MDRLGESDQGGRVELNLCYRVTTVTTMGRLKR